MKKREAIALTLKDGTKVRKSTWLPNNFVYYCWKDGKIYWLNGDLYTAFNCYLEEDGWEVYREEVIAKGVIELFQKHKQIGRPYLLWKVDTISVVRSRPFVPSDPDRILLYWEPSGEPVHLNSEIIVKTFTLIHDESSKGSNHEA